MEIFPISIPGPLYANLVEYELQAYRENDAEIGPPTRELLTDNPPAYFNVGFLFDPLNFQIFEGWFRYNINRGVASFEMDLPVGMGIVTHECVMNSYNAAYQGKLISVTTTVRAFAKQFNTETQARNLILIANVTSEYIKTTFFNRLIQFVDDDLPDSWEWFL